MAVEDTPRLTALSSHHVVQPISPQRSVICSPHDLIAIVTHTGDVTIYRLNGQVAFTIRNPDTDVYVDGRHRSFTGQERAGAEHGVRVTCVCWSPNGRRIAVAWSNGTWNVREGEKGSVVIEGNIEVQDAEKVVVGFGWERHAGGGEGQSERFDTALATMDLDEWNEEFKESGVSEDRTDKDLSRAVTKLDPSQVLPRLSALPSHGLRTGPEGTNFASQIAADSVFASSTPGVADDGVEVLLVYTSDGAVQVMLNGTSHIGTVQASQSADTVWCTSRSKSSAHALLADAGVPKLQLNVLDLPLADLGGMMLHRLSSSTAQVNSLLSYIQKTIRCIIHDFTTGTFYPTRLTNSVSATIKDDDVSSASLPSALTHLAMTGEFHPAVLEWLADIVKEAGLKRWDASVCGMYSAIQGHLHSHVLPALDRMSIAITSVRGLARFHQGNAAFEPDELLFTEILDAIDALRLLATDGMMICVREWSLWRSFAKWLRMEIEIAIAGPGSKAAAETEEREVIGIEYEGVLEYVKRVMEAGSGLQSLVNVKTGTADSQWTVERVRTFVEGHGEKSKKTASGLMDLVAWLDTRVQAAMVRVRMWQSRMLSPPKTVDVELVDAGKVRDVRWVHDESCSSMEASKLIILTLSGAQNDALSVYEIKEAYAFKGDRCSVRQNREESELEQSQNGVADAKLIDGGASILLLRGSREAAPRGDDVHELVRLNRRDNSVSTVHRFPAAEQFTPESLLVGGREGKEFCVVFGQGDRSWQVLDLRSSSSTQRGDIRHLAEVFESDDHAGPSIQSEGAYKFGAESSRDSTRRRESTRALG